MIIFIIQDCSGDQIEKNEIGGHVARMGERCIQGFVRET